MLESVRGHISVPFPTFRYIHFTLEYVFSSLRIDFFMCGWKERHVKMVQNEYIHWKCSYLSSFPFSRPYRHQKSTHLSVSLFCSHHIRPSLFLPLSCHHHMSPIHFYLLFPIAAIRVHRLASSSSSPSSPLFLERDVSSHSEAQGRQGRVEEKH